jgi:hypothetical protein
LLLLIGSALVNLYPQHLPPNILQGSPADVVHFETKTQAVGTTSLGEFNPIWVTDSLKSSPLVDDYLAGRPINRLDASTLPPGATGLTVSSTVQSHRLKVSLPVPATITLNLLYFPGWQAKLNGEPISLAPHPGSGLIDLSLPAGNHTLTLTFGETPLRRLADIISIVAWAGLVVWVGIELKQALGSRLSAFGSRQPAASDWSAVGLTAASITVILVAYFAFPGRFRLASPPDQALSASIPLRADFSDQIRLLGVDLPPEVVAPGDRITVVAYWRALQDLKTDYTVYLHLDAPNGQTIASVDQAHPTEIPTSAWPPALHLRNPLKLTVPPDTPPIRYNLQVGWYNHKTGERLFLPAGQGDILEVGQVWVESPSPIKPPPGPSIHFGKSIHLLGLKYDHVSQTVTLYWQTDAHITQDYSIFLHLLDASGTMIGQIDGTPYQNLYPTPAWRTGQVIQDSRSIGEAVEDIDQISQLAVGVYDPLSGKRLPAVDEEGNALPNNALILKFAAMLN